jgi:hypothetical protein
LATELPSPHTGASPLVFHVFRLHIAEKCFTIKLDCPCHRALCISMGPLFSCSRRRFTKARCAALPACIATFSSVDNVRLRLRGNSEYDTAAARPRRERSMPSALFSNERRQEKI